RFLESSCRACGGSAGEVSASLIPFLNPRIVSPAALPTQGSFLGPKTKRATINITISSGAPRLPNIVTSGGRNHATIRDTGCQSRYFDRYSDRTSRALSPADVLGNDAVCLANQRFSGKPAR